MIDVGVIGLGFMGVTIKAYRAIPGARIAAICGLQTASRRVLRVAGMWPIRTREAASPESR
jgi:predicted dehydrogenase